MQTWIKTDKNSDFSIYNLPFGVYSIGNKSKRIGVAIGDLILDLNAINKLGVFDELNINSNVFVSNYINDFISLGKKTTVKAREILQKELCNISSVLRNDKSIFNRS